MIRLWPVALLFAVAACATSGPKPGQAGSAQAAAPQTQAAETTEAQAGQPGVVCQKVVKTGSIMPTTVCRQKADAERQQEADRKVYEDIRRNTTLGTTGH